MRRFIVLASVCAGAACDPDVVKDFGSVDDTAAEDTGETGDDSSAPDRGTGDVNGTVSVQLTTTNEAGDVVPLSWEEYGGAFPFGAIYVAAYTRDETTGETTYHAEQVIAAPNTAGDPYSLAVDLDDAEEVYVYAALDWWPDGVIGTAEPIGTYRDPIAVVEGSAVDGVDIVISSPLLPTGGGGGGSYVDISGDLTITEEYGGGIAKVMLYDNASQGPYYVANVTPVATEDGAAAPYTLTVGAGAGETRLIAAWDVDQNGLVEPTDTWGAYVVEGENGNPITVGTGALAGYDVEIPFGIPPAITPFVRIDGTLTYEADYGTLPAGAVVYVAALRTRPSGEFAATELEEGYDWASWTGAELVGTTLDFVLVAPSSATAYLVAFADLDGNGMVNEAGEPFGSYGATGQFSTGTTNLSDVGFWLNDVGE